MTRHPTIAAILVLCVLLAGCSDEVGTIARSTPTGGIPTPLNPTPAIGADVPPTEAGPANVEVLATPTPASDILEVAKRESTGTVMLESEGVVITVHRVAVASFQEFYAASDEAGRRALDTFGDAEGALTIGQIELSIENASGSRRTVYPNQGTVVVGNEQVDVSLFLSDDIGGEYFPGVVKEGRVLFFLKRLAYTDVASVLYVVGYPFGETFNFAAQDYEFTISVQ
jgi:hypothetical protein